MIIKRRSSFSYIWIPQEILSRMMQLVYKAAWGTCSPTLLHEVDHIHARAAKIIYRLSDVSTQEAITIAGWESINSTYKRKLLTFMYEVYKSELPDNGETKYQTWWWKGYNFVVVVVVVFSLGLSMTNTFSSIVRSRYLYLTTRVRFFCQLFKPMIRKTLK